MSVSYISRLFVNQLEESVPSSFSEFSPLLLCLIVVLLCLCASITPQSIWRCYHEDVFTPVQCYIMLNIEISSFIFHELEIPQSLLKDTKPKWSYTTSSRLCHVKWKLCKRTVVTSGMCTALWHFIQWNVVTVRSVNTASPRPIRPVLTVAFPSVRVVITDKSCV